MRRLTNKRPAGDVVPGALVVRLAFALARNADRPFQEMDGPYCAAARRHGEDRRAGRPLTPCLSCWWSACFMVGCEVARVFGGRMPHAFEGGPGFTTQAKEGEVT